jgi:hypothetical protein
VLPDDLMAGGKGDQVGEPLQRQDRTVLHIGGNRIRQG